MPDEPKWDGHGAVLMPEFPLPLPAAMSPEAAGLHAWEGRWRCFPYIVELPEAQAGLVDVSREDRPDVDRSAGRCI